MDRNSQRALARFRKAEAERDRSPSPSPNAKALGIATAPMLRVRKASDVDLAKADPSCKRCLGTGLLGTKVIPGNRGCEPNRIPLVCRCVARGGGVVQPSLRSPSPNAKPTP